VASFSEEGNKPSGPIKGGKFSDHLTVRQLLKERYLCGVIYKMHSDVY
jgi:hypothetical protein